MNTRTTVGVAAAFAAALVLTGCATVTAVPAGPYRVGGGYQVALGREWSDISAMMAGKTKKVRLLSLDGPLLNRLYLTDGLAAGDFLIKPQSKETPTPVIRSDMSPSERLEFIADSLAALEYQHVELVKPRPGAIGDTPGVRFDVTAQTKDGLDIRGAGLVAVRDSKVYVLLYLAPAEYYFQANLADVEAIMASARLG